ncbi:Epoxide hydrolase [Cystobacter fuscus DSM 2262]|uniref:Epoxide hydrolase n=2 Tax=Cystobacter fuscus TaxID=43 RepID=S9PBA2_CYSF2|nr:Epoxide hydrolase [Cystobacter fuscus DSM 2262]
MDLRRLGLVAVWLVCTTPAFAEAPREQGPEAGRSLDPEQAQEGLLLEHQYADINGIRMHYVTQGAGEPIIFLHGFPEYWGVWKKPLEEMGRDHWVIAPDMRGYNLSSKPADVEQYHIEKLVADIRALADHLKIKRFTLVSQDWGALVGWSFVLRHPEYVRRFVTINITHPALFNRDLREDAAQQQASQYMLLFRSPEAEPFIMADDYAFGRQGMIDAARQLGAQISAEDEAEMITAWKQPGAITGGLNYYRAARIGPPDGQGSLGGSNLLDGLYPQQLQVYLPVLFIHGEMDPYLLPSGQVGLEEYVHDLTFRRIPDADHSVTLEKPELVTQFLREFMLEN